MHLRFFILFYLFATALYAQPDSSSLLLTPEHLDERNVENKKAGIPIRKAISATRSLEEVTQLPFTVWVVTADDIMRNGFVTLGDVLKAAPGVRVSQPGNSLEGETFMLRGLSGNQYVKVLINDVPVKPSVAQGMPIGSQLPIRQAERIEVVFGPASAIYGDGACAGVVNIILKETERPIFTQADLSFGNYSYNSLDLMLGGKLFQDKNIFRFSLYGSSTVRERLDYFYDDNLFKTKNYLVFGLDSTLYTESPNYRGREMGDSVARSAPISHESRMLGINLTWRGIQFNYNRLIRIDHSSLGLSPLAVSYSNPSNQIIEQIETAAIRFQKRRTKRTATNTISLTRYQVRNSSTFTPVFDHLGSALYYAKSPQIQTPAERQIVLDSIYKNYASDERYFVSDGIDLRFESRISATLQPYLYLDAGLQTNMGGGTPPMGYFDAPVQAIVFGNDEDSSQVRPFNVKSDGYLDANIFAQLHYRTKKMTFIGGSSVNFAFEHSIAVAPRLAMQYRPDSTWVFRASYSEGFLRPTIYSRVQTYNLNVQSDTLAATAYSHNVEKTERTRCAEFAVRRYSGRFTTDLLFFYQTAHNLARNGYLRQIDQNWRYGYENAPGQALSIWGIQGTIGNDILNFDLRKNTPQGGSITGRFEFYFQYSRGQEQFGYGLPATNDVRNFPRWITQVRFSFRGKKWELIFSSNRQKNILSSAVVYQDLYQRETILNKYGPIRTWDATFNLFVSKNFQAYVHFKNLFNRHYPGIDATGTQDDLLYNPQPGRTFRIGVNYNMN